MTHSVLKPSKCIICGKIEDMEITYEGCHYCIDGCVHCNFTGEVFLDEQELCQDCIQDEWDIGDYE